MDKLPEILPVVFSFLLAIVRINLFVGVGTTVIESGSFGEHRFDFRDSVFFAKTGKVHRVTIKVGEFLDNTGAPVIFTWFDFVTRFAKKPAHFGEESIFFFFGHARTVATPNVTGLNAEMDVYQFGGVEEFS